MGFQIEEIRQAPHDLAKELLQTFRDIEREISDFLTMPHVMRFFAMPHVMGRKGKMQDLRSTWIAVSETI